MKQSIQNFILHSKSIHKGKNVIAIVQASQHDVVQVVSFSIIITLALNFKFRYLLMATFSTKIMAPLPFLLVNVYSPLSPEKCQKSQWNILKCSTDLLPSGLRNLKNDYNYSPTLTWLHSKTVPWWLQLLFHCFSIYTMNTKFPYMIIIGLNKWQLYWSIICTSW